MWARIQKFRFRQVKFKRAETLLKSLVFKKKPLFITGWFSNLINGKAPIKFIIWLLGSSRKA